MTIRISFSDLWTYADSLARNRLPIAQLPANGEGHIHGRLDIVVNGRPLPYLGYFGPDDVCFNEWFRELVRSAEALQAGEPSGYTYDEGEQGQPAFRFQRNGSVVLVSIVESELSGAGADLDWQNVECGLIEFVKSIDAFRKEFTRKLFAECPEGGPRWISNVLSA